LVKIALNNFSAEARCLIIEANNLRPERTERYGGTLSENHQSLARLWSEILDVEITASQVLLMLALNKINRIAKSPGHVHDNWLDTINYLIGAYETSVEESRDE